MTEAYLDWEGEEYRVSMSCTSQEKRMTDLESVVNDANVKEFLAALRSAAKQEVVSAKTTLLKPILLQLQEKVQRQVWQSAQNWTQWKDDGPVVYPDDCKLFYQKGNSAVMIVEQKPNVRTVVFDSKLVSSNSAEDRSFTFNLAFPYVIFLFSFTNGVFNNLFLFYLNQPFTDLGQKPLTPNLTNLGEGNVVCMGGSFKKAEEDPYNYAGTVRKSLDYFWSSRFTNEWHTAFWDAQKRDARIATPRKWEESSRQNPLFATTVPWKESSHPSFRNAISRCWDSDTKVREVQKHLYKTIVEESIDEIETAFTAVASEGDDFNALKTVLQKAIAAKTGAEEA